MQVKDHWVLTVMKSLSITIMTGQGRICVQCVASGLQGNNTWMFTERVTLKKTCIHVLSVWNFFRLRVDYVTIWIFIAVNTSVQNVANVFNVVNTWQHTDKVIQERNRLNVLFVANDLHGLSTLLDTAEFTVERNRTHVMCVAQRLHGLEVYTVTWESTQETNHTSVHCVTNVSASPAACSDINVVYTATEDHMTVLTVGSCLRQTLNWRVILLFTLMQSRTRVDTVQTVLEDLTNSRDIYWTHTMNVLGSRVAFVSSSSFHVLIWSNIQVNIMKMWSRMFAVNVQSVSVEQLNWVLIVWFTSTTNSFDYYFC